MPMISRPATNEQMWHALRIRRPMRTPSEDGVGGTPPGGHQDHAVWLRGPVQDTLDRRRSVRAFTDEPLPTAMVLEAMAAACNADTILWPPHRHGRPDFQLLVAAFNVSGLTAGLYAACADEGGGLLRLDFPGLDSLREQYATAPVLLLVCGNLNQACRIAGPSCYASVLVRAGTIGYGAWLWAISNGLAGSVYGGASHQVSSAAHQVDADQWHLFTVALGHPQRPQPRNETELPA